MLVRQHALADMQAATQVHGVLLDYLTLTKPLIILLLLVTAIGGMFLAQEGVPSAKLIAWVLIGGSLGAGGANALNHFVERDLDLKMTRTRRRPVASRRIAPWHAFSFGVGLNIGAFVIFALWVNLLSAFLTFGATLFYVLVYTIWLKRSTTQNIVIGGAAGAIPPLVGWAAVTGDLGLPALYLFAIIFFWTPVHFWALALLLRRDYARANVPMLPVIRGAKETAWNILLYSALLVALTLVFFTAMGLGMALLWLSWKLWRQEGAGNARNTYLFSLFYLAAIFAAIMIDSTLSR